MKHDQHGTPLRARNNSIDAFRLIANWVVICVHTAPFMAATFSSNVRIFGELVNQFVRVATPFFFLAAGYFFAISLERGAMAVPLARKLIQRLIRFFVFWSIVYILLPIDMLLQIPQAGYWATVGITMSRAISWHFLMNGTAVHLWFLPALSCALAIMAAALRFRFERSLIGLSCVLFIVGLLAGAYKATPIGFDLHMNTRNGPFFSTIFVVSGFMFHRLGILPTLRQALSLILLGIALRILELSWITGSYGTAPSQIDYLLGTYPFGVGIFSLLLTTQRLGDIKWMVALSQYSAGVYCAHGLIVALLGSVHPGAAVALWEVARPFAALALSLALVTSLAKVPILRPVVT